MIDTEEIHRRLDDHSKRILKIETWQIQFSKDMTMLSTDLGKIGEALFGSSDLTQSSLKTQLIVLNRLVTELNESVVTINKTQLAVADRVRTLENWREKTDEWRQKSEANGTDWKKLGMQALLWAFTFIISTWVASLIR